MSIDLHRNFIVVLVAVMGALVSGILRDAGARVMI
jgi:hypothetical protein